MCSVDLQSNLNKKTRSYIFKETALVFGSILFYGTGWGGGREGLLQGFMVIIIAFSRKTLYSIKLNREVLKRRCCDNIQSTSFSRPVWKVIYKNCVNVKNNSTVIDLLV